MQKFVSVEDICTATGYSIDVWRKGQMIFGKPKATSARIDRHGKNSPRKTHVGFEIEATVLWLLERVPSFNEIQENTLRSLARPHWRET